jgi:hypothetical protein
LGLRIRGARRLPAQGRAWRMASLRRHVCLAADFGETHFACRTPCARAGSDWLKYISHHLGGSTVPNAGSWRRTVGARRARSLPQCSARGSHTQTPYRKSAIHAAGPGDSSGGPWPVRKRSHHRARSYCARRMTQSLYGRTLTRFNGPRKSGTPMGRPAHRRRIHTGHVTS